MRPRVLLVACLALIAAASLLLVPATRARLAALGSHGSLADLVDPSADADKKDQAQIAAQAAPPLPRLAAPANPTAIKAPTATNFFGWAFLDRSTGAITGSANRATGTNSTESMVKAWITADYLRQLDAAGKAPTNAVLNDLTLMIIDSNDNMAEKYYEADGANAVIQRMINMCGLTNTTIYPYWWSKTQMSPQDAVRYGMCVADGVAAGPKWTPWLLDTMKHVRGGVADQVSVTQQGGRWGIIDGLPANLVPDTSIKNGWTQYGDGWHVNCLAINPAWVLNVMVRIPGSRLQTAADVCKSVAQQLTVTPDI
jgi:hypothetical protein